MGKLQEYWSLLVRDTERAFFVALLLVALCLYFISVLPSLSAPLYKANLDIRNGDVSYTSFGKEYKNEQFSKDLRDFVIANSLSLTDEEALEVFGTEYNVEKAIPNWSGMRLYRNFFLGLAALKDICPKRAGELIKIFQKTGLDEGPSHEEIINMSTVGIFKFYKMGNFEESLFSIEGNCQCCDEYEAAKI